MLVYLWYTLITQASVGMPVITIIYIDLHPLPDSFVGQSMKHSYHQPPWWSGEKEAAVLTPACSFTHTHSAVSSTSPLCFYTYDTCVHSTSVDMPGKCLLAQSNNPYIPCTKRSLPWYWHACDTFICRAYVSMSVKTKLAVVQSCVYLLNINTSTLQHLLYDTSMPPCLQSKCDRYSWLYAVLAHSYFWTIRLFQLG